MKLDAPYRCDYCPTQKGKTNHWWLLWVGLGRDDRDVFLLRPWDDAKANTGDHEHICSESCATKALSQYMAKVNTRPAEIAEEMAAQEAG